MFKLNNSHDDTVTAADLHPVFHKSLRLWEKGNITSAVFRQCGADGVKSATQSLTGVTFAEAVSYLYPEHQTSS